MFLTTVQVLPGCSYRLLDMVVGSAPLGATGQYESPLFNGFSEACRSLTEAAESLGANAVIGVQLSVLPNLVVVVTGTAIVLEEGERPLPTRRRTRKQRDERKQVGWSVGGWIAAGSFI